MNESIDKYFLIKLPVFSFERVIDGEVAVQLKNFIKGLPREALGCRLRIKSSGGNRAARILMTRYLVVLKQRGCHIFTEGVEIFSEAFNLFLMGDTRIVDSHSHAGIHLPEGTVQARVSQKRTAEIQRQTANFIKSKTRLNEQQIYALNLKELSVSYMLKHDIVDQIMDLNF